MNFMVMAPTFGERFSFARWWQTLVAVDESDADFARNAYGATNSSSVTDYRNAERTPNTNRLPAIAKRTRVDYGWLIGDIDEPPDDFSDRALFVAAWDRWRATWALRSAKPTTQEEPAPAEVFRRTDLPEVIPDEVAPKAVARGGKKRR